ncbi:MAG: non-heme iron oxygenase ferredoxin subunit [Anaerolineales bacterium]|nr:non-heme iron oxygenase ferredoxin subunit [Anaerolineales bacterium]
MSLNYNERKSEELEFVIVAEEGSLSNGDRLFVEIDEFRIVVFNIAGKYFAIEDVCSHDDGPLGDGEFEDEFEIACPRHGARFDVRNGHVLSLPAVEDIPAYPVRVADGNIEIGIPVE